MNSLGEIEQTSIYTILILIFHVINNMFSAVVYAILDDISADLSRKAIDRPLVPFVIIFVVIFFAILIAIKLAISLIPHYIMVDNVGIDTTRRLMPFVILLKTIILFSYGQQINIIGIIFWNCIIYRNLNRFKL